MTHEALGFDAMYAAVAGRDPRFDGAFYTAVHTTGIYCRPSCPARTPLQRNVSFYPSAAAAQSAGFRACRRCVPEALPGSALWDVPGSVSSRALDLIERGVVDESGVEGLADWLGWSSRSVTRTLVEHTGAGPLDHARARRARVAHELITGTDEPFATIAFAAGFSSIRQFNDTIRTVYDLTPSQIRTTRSLGGAAGTVRSVLTYRPPLAWSHLLRWYHVRALPGIDEVDEERQSYRLGLRLTHGDAVADLTDDPERSRILATLRLSDLKDVGEACTLLRRMVDLDADTVGIERHLSDSLPARVTGQPDSLIQGLRIPGTATPVEALLRALTGQQVSVASGRAQLVHLTGEPSDELRPFPAADTILADGLDWFRGPEKRRATIRAALELASAGALDPSNDPSDVATALLAVPGIGPWTVAYTLLRGYGHPNVDLSGDHVIATALSRITDEAPRQALMGSAPWRSYAAMQLWSS